MLQHEYAANIGGHYFRGVNRLVFSFILSVIMWWFPSGSPSDCTWWIISSCKYVSICIFILLLWIKSPYWSSTDTREALSSKAHCLVWLGTILIDHQYYTFCTYWRSSIASQAVNHNAGNDINKSIYKIRYFWAAYQCKNLRMHVKCFWESKTICFVIYITFEAAVVK